MRLLLQRVSAARVEVDEANTGQRRTTGQIGQGLLVLVGFGKADAPDLPGSRVWRSLCDKILDLRVFPALAPKHGPVAGESSGKLDASLRDLALAGHPEQAGLLLVSQFTLYADLRRGRRPSFSDAAAPEVARGLYDRLVADLGAAAPGPFGSGVFGAEMHLTFTNWGPVTLLLDSADFAA